MFDNIALNFATVSAVVAAFISVVGNAFNIPSKYRALLAIITGAILMALPDWLMQKSVTSLLIGLTASGVYTQVKKRDYSPPNVDQASKEPRIKGPSDV